ncbi:prolyl aminopeptidase [Mycoplasma seminis]|uniref:Proline iminopeptidase n=1 Tax=Mycoplasma seminis TaxID=512749 RepID=A0ABY9HAI1_9MOLU|nr:prolyl aminopeptidase [Mycoplasma seminis]WLP85496.1 prolyl aminopeptidase [Mycoplasma seminis]
MKLFSNIEPYEKGYLQVDDIHSLYYEVSGNPNGQAVFFFHGGPGGSTSAKCRRFFDPKFYKIVLFDQRGAGKSKPYCELKNNTTQELVEDVEKLRKHLNLGKVVILGGSWGSTLAMCYAIKYAKNIKALILRGVFLARQEDIDFLYEKGADVFYPDYFAKYKKFVENEKGNSILEKYYNLLIGDDLEKRKQAADLFANWESEVVSINKAKLHPNFKSDYQIALLESHYFMHNSFFPNDNYILDNIDKFRDIRTIIVHGRQDIDTRPIGAWLVANELTNVELNLVDGAGHTQWDARNQALLVKATETIKKEINEGKI